MHLRDISIFISIIIIFRCIFLDITFKIRFFCVLVLLRYRYRTMDLKFQRCFIRWLVLLFISLLLFCQISICRKLCFFFIKKRRKIKFSLTVGFYSGLSFFFCFDGFSPEFLLSVILRSLPCKCQLFFCQFFLQNPDFLCPFFSTDLPA